MTPSTYRPDIDGLRALAVLSVLFFHLDVARFSGGFLGVDVFFVISGFLITRLIRKEILSTGGFDFARFYIRRARRLFPALFFTLACCFVISFMLFSPQHFQRFGGAAVYALTSLSNFYFWRESGYFDTTADLKPLLHTWSLSVEEQFYLVWPAVLTLLLLKAPRFTAPAFILAAGVFSFFLNFVFMDGQSSLLEALSPAIAGLFSDGEATIFYLAPFRVFEFGLGALMAWLIQIQPKRKILLEPLFLAGLAATLWPILFYPEDVAFSPLYALIACAGASLMIYAGTARYAARALNNPPAIWIGLISYSLYLAHWPIIVFFRYYKFDELSVTDKGVIVAAAFLIAYLMFRYVERPFRFGRYNFANQSRAFAGLLYVSVAFMGVLIASNVWASKGWGWRYALWGSPELKAQLDKDLQDFITYADAPSQTKKTFSDNGKPKLLVIGDSQGRDFLNILSEHQGADQLDTALLRTRNACQAALGLQFSVIEKYVKASWKERCEAIHGNMNAKLRTVVAEADIVVFAVAWTSWGARYYATATDQLRLFNPDARVIAIGPKTQGFNGLSFASRFGLLPQDEQLKKYRPYNLEFAESIETILEENPGDDFYISLYDILCGENERERCRAIAPDGGVIMFDNNHLTPDGAKYFNARFEELGIWDEILAPKAPRAGP